MEQNERNYDFMLKVREAYETAKDGKESSIRAVATKLNLSRTKVRKILVTLGVIKSEITETAKKLKDQGLTIEEIADEMGLSMATVSTYLPYDSVIYNGEEKSANAVRIERYRERIQKNTDNQVHHANNTKEEYEENPSMRKREYTIYKLHMELDTDGADMETLRKYGKVKNGITRDILVPSNITLHALHYVIQRAFGWQNSHLHHFEVPEALFEKMTNNHFGTWTDYCGIYFRFPRDDMDDLYWDDDYNGDVSIRTWLRKKYTGLYQYHGTSEHLMEARYAAVEFLEENKTVRVMPPFSEWQNLSEKERNTQRTINIDDATCKDMELNFENGNLGELLERLKLSEILTNDKTDVDVKAFVKDVLKRCDANGNEFIKLHNRMADGDGYDYWRKMNEVNGTVLPLTDEITYQYDYGDGWEVKISHVDTYCCDSAWDHPGKDGYVIMAVTPEQVYDDLTPLYKDGTVIEGELGEQIKTMIMNRRPLCINADGLPVLDDVGGVSGYCNMLLGLHGKNGQVSPYDNPEETKVWASGMGWTGRMNKAEKIL